MIEHFAGAFPVWLAPVQVQIIPVSQVHRDYCLKVQKELKKLGVKVKIDDRHEKLGYKIREAQMQKIPYMVVIGDNEVEEESLNVRKYGEQQSKSELFKDFKHKVIRQIQERSL